MYYSSGTENHALLLPYQLPSNGEQEEIGGKDSNTYAGEKVGAFSDKVNRGQNGEGNQSLLAWFSWMAEWRQLEAKPRHVLHYLHLGLGTWHQLQQAGAKYFRHTPDGSLAMMKKKVEIKQVDKANVNPVSLAFSLKFQEQKLNQKAKMN
eukprot:s2789_g6.t1